MKLPIYLDYMATTPVDQRVAEKMCAYLTSDGIFGNPSSQHFYGQQANTAVEEARQKIANAFNVDKNSIIFTSGATEADNLAIKGATTFYERQGKHIVTCKTEHKAVLDTCKFLETRGFIVTYLTPEKDGVIELNKLEAALRPDTILVSIMHANNEIGVIQDIAAIGEITHKRGILFHVDAAQSAGKLPIDLKNIKVDMMSFSAHKIYGPKGIGALYLRQKPKIHLTPQIHGGEQEFGLRSGTLATHQIVGMGETLQIASQEMTQENQRILTLRNHLWDNIKNIENVYLNGSLEKRLPGNLNVSFGGIDGELLIAALNDLAISSSAACHKAVYEPSHVLLALGIKRELALSTIRFSIGRFTTKEEIDYTIEYVNKVVKTLR